MQTLKINIFSFLFSWSAYSTSSKKSISKPSTDDNEKKPSKDNTSKESSSENNLSCSSDNGSIYYLPVHLM